MDEHTVRTLGFILAEQARIYSMLAANEGCKFRGEAPAYDEQHFHQVAFTIENIARDTL